MKQYRLLCALGLTATPLMARAHTLGDHDGGGLLHLLLTHGAGPVLLLVSICLAYRMLRGKLTVNRPRKQQR